MFDGNNCTYGPSPCFLWQVDVKLSLHFADDLVVSPDADLPGERPFGDSVVSVAVEAVHLRVLEVEPSAVKGHSHHQLVLGDTVVQVVMHGGKDVVGGCYVVLIRRTVLVSLLLTPDKEDKGLGGY